MPNNFAYGELTAGESKTPHMTERERRLFMAALDLIPLWGREDVSDEWGDEFQALSDALKEYTT